MEDPWLQGMRPVVPGYTIEALVGAGGFALVWSARRERDGLPVAIKVAREPSFALVDRLDREATVLTAIGPPYVPAHYEHGRLPTDHKYIVMELLTGHTLAALLESMPGPPDIGRVRALSDALLGMLDAIHGRGVMHRDLKPENIFVLGESPVALRLMDFGLTKAVLWHEATLTGASIIGTTEYMAPEQIRGAQDIDTRADIYAFGVVLYELFTLRPPFVGSRAAIEHAHTSFRPPRPRLFAPVPEAVEDIILACLAKDPARRPADAATLRVELEHAFHRGKRRATTLPDNERSLLMDKRQPVVLLAAFCDDVSSSSEVNRRVKRFGGFVARQRGRLFLCVFASATSDDPGQLALGCASDLVETFSARVAVHLARVPLRRKRRGPPVVLGRVVEEPEQWLPQGSWDGTLVSRSFADSRADAAVRPAPGHSGFFVLADDEAPASPGTFVGRDAFMERAVESAVATIRSSSPGLFTVIGDTGLGKTRLSQELAAELGRRMPDIEILAVRCERPLSVSSEQEGDRVQASVIALMHALGVALGTDAVEPEPARIAPAAAGIHPVAMIIDDAHWATKELLDHVEYATLDHPGVPLWIAVIAHPRLDMARRQWGGRANRHERVELTSLDGDAARTLAAELLLPAEYPPAAFLNQLAQWAGGNPQLLTQLVAELKRQGVVRKRDEGDAWYVATAELAELPPVTAEQWLATRRLDEMEPELAACARVCAVLGLTFRQDELAWMQDVVEAHGGASTPIDAEVGLAALVRHGVLQRISAEEVAFTSPALQDALYKLLGTQDREVLHGYAVEYWRMERDQGTSTDALERFARHAGACGRHDEAADSYIALGDAARAAHRYVEADNHYTAALRLTADAAGVLALEEASDDASARVYSFRSPHDRRYALSLAGRGKVRYHIHRLREAADDLACSRAIFARLGDERAVVDLLLEEATVADHMCEWSVSAACAEEAQRLVAAMGAMNDDTLATRCLVALGRTAWRKGQISRAIELFSEAADRARRGGDDETTVQALLILGPALVCEDRVDRLEAAQLVFDEALALCVKRRDRLHQCAVYGNRIFLWRRLHVERAPEWALERAIDDLRRAIRLSREIGNPEPERVATHNLAELLFWRGEPYWEEALSLARRSRVLQQRFWKNVPEDALLLARIYAAIGELAQAAELLAWIRRACGLEALAPAVRLFYRVVELVLAEQTGRTSAHLQARGDDAWQALFAEAEAANLAGEERLEVLWWGANAALAAGRVDDARHALGRCRALLAAAPVWEPSLTALERTIDGALATAHEFG